MYRSVNNFHGTVAYELIKLYRYVQIVNVM